MSAPPPQAPPSPKSTAPKSSKKKFKTAKPNKNVGERIMIYGGPGIGKSSLAALAPKPVFIDLDRSARTLPDATIIEGVGSFADVRTVAQDAEIFAGFETLVIDSCSPLQDMAVAYTLATVKHEKGQTVQSVEGYGFGKGYQFVDDTFTLLLADLDRLVEGGLNVILVAHECTSMAPNPEGEDFLRYEPNLQQPPKQGRIRDRVKAWVDHMLFISYDKFVKDKKAEGSGSRSIYTADRPAYWAKSRILPDAPILYPDGDGAVWATMFK